MFVEKKCPQCGKIFVRASFVGYLYKIGTKTYCGWNCYNKAKEKKNAARSN